MATQQPSALSLFPARVVIGFVNNDPKQPIYMSAEFYRAMNKLFSEFSGLVDDGGVDVFASMFPSSQEVADVEMQPAASDSGSVFELIQPLSKDRIAEQLNQPVSGFAVPEMIFQSSSSGLGVPGGTAGSVLYQSAPNVTGFTAVGTAGQAMVSGGAGSPTWTTGTLALAGNLATAGAYAVTMTFSGATGVTFPTTGTLATLAGSETLTNKSLSSPEITGTLVGTTTFTPGLTFGGGSTGMTFSTRNGRYSRIGNIVIFRLYLALSAKGSSTGAAVVTGLPVGAANNSAEYQTFPVYISGTAAAIGAHVTGYLEPTGTVFNLTKTSAAAFTQMTDADFSNTTDMIVQGAYFV